jgi:hypothetical protein
MVRQSVLITTRRGTETPRSRHLSASVPRWVVFAVTVLLAACGPSEPLKVAAIQTGKSLNSDNSIATHSTSFRPKDPMYVSVLTEARGAGTIRVTWSLGGRVIHEATKDVSYTDQAATDFRFAAADGFPPGEYTIEVFVDGQSVGMRSVRVQ